VRTYFVIYCINPSVSIDNNASSPVLIEKNKGLIPEKIRKKILVWSI